MFEIPLGTPRNGEAIGLNVDRQPYIATVDRVSGSPAIGDEDEFAFFAGYREDVGALRAKGELRILAEAGIAQFSPWPFEGFGHCGEGGIWSPAGGVRTDVEVVAIRLEDGGPFKGFVLEDAREVSRGVEIVAGQLRQVLGLVIL